MKRAQITVFVMIGLLALMVVALLVALPFLGQSEIPAFKSQELQQCADISARQAVDGFLKHTNEEDIFGSNGLLDDLVVYDADAILYQESVQENIARAAQKFMEECTGDSLSGMTVSVLLTGSQARVEYKQVPVDVTKKISLSSTQQTEILVLLPVVQTILRKGPSTFTCDTVLPYVYQGNTVLVFPFTPAIGSNTAYNKFTVSRGQTSWVFLTQSNALQAGCSQ